ncbi:MAG: hypothetical protein LBG80_06965 [Bacteroidales bacterium]|jgi:hypothetical protein|nr:hypothetical protein [Bacteroidales bacterium]
MKRIIISIVFIIVLVPLNAQWTAKTDTKRHHYLQIAAKGGVNTFLYKGSSIRLSGGGGLLYDYYFLPFMGFGTGAEISVLRSVYHIKDISYQQQAIDDDPLFGTSGQSFLFCVDIENANEVQQATMLYVPLMLRFRFGYFYLGTGVKAGFCINARHKKNMGLLKTYGVYENVYEPGILEDIPEHGFVMKSSVTKRFSYDLKTDWAVCLDFGINIHPSPYNNRVGRRTKWAQHVYLGVYADYGINNLQKSSTTNPVKEYPVIYNTNVEGCLEYDENSIVNSVTGKGVHSFSAGIKFAVGLNWR